VEPRAILASAGSGEKEATLVRQGHKEKEATLVRQARSGRQASSGSWVRQVRAGRLASTGSADCAGSLAPCCCKRANRSCMHRTTRNSTKRSLHSVNEQNVTLQARSVTNKRQRTDAWHFHEDPRATFKTARHEHTHRHTVEAPIFHTSLRSQPRVSVRLSVHLEVYAPVLFQRIRNESRVTRPIFILANS
jgi:hypothetical protein